VAKVRVHELAKELGITSKDAVTKLQELGEFVRSASSTIEAPVVKKLRDAFPAGSAGSAQKSAKAPAARPGDTGAKPGAGRPGPKPPVQQAPRSGSPSGTGSAGGSRRVRSAGP
jgi:translation initiation factor IF-2